MTITASSADGIAQAVARSDDESALRLVADDLATGRISAAEASFWRSFIASMLEADDLRALQLARKAVEDDRRYAPGWHALATASIDVSRSRSTPHAVRCELRREASAAGIRACRLDPEAPHYWMALGRAVWDRGHPRLAERCRSRAIREAMAGVDELPGETVGRRYFENVIRGRGPTSVEFLKIAMLGDPY